MNCKKCRYDHGSYHCLDCPHFDDDSLNLKPFCNYCNKTPHTDACGNCVWEDYKL